MTIATEDTTSGWNFTMRQRRKKRFIEGLSIRRYLRYLLVNPHVLANPAASRLAG
jgi:hypothetical protein